MLRVYVGYSSVRCHTFKMLSMSKTILRLQGVTNEWQRTRTYTSVHTNFSVRRAYVGSIRNIVIQPLHWPHYQRGGAQNYQSTHATLWIPADHFQKETAEMVWPCNMIGRRKRGLLKPNRDRNTTVTDVGHGYDVPPLSAYTTWEVCGISKQ